MTIYIDSFEPRSIERRIVNLRVPVARKRLPAGDYAFSNIGVERKTIDDFINSVFQARMWDQLFKLKEVYEHPLLVLIGKTPFPTSHNILGKLKSAWGAKWNIGTSIGIPILEFDNDDQFVISLVQGYLQVTNKRLSYKPLPPKKKSILEIKIDMLSRIPGVGIKTAKFLVEEYNSIEELIKVPVLKLSEYKGISEKKAILIKKVICNGGKSF